MLFPWVFGCTKLLSKFFASYITISASLRKILLIKLIPITLCMSISSPEPSYSLASFSCAIGVTLEISWSVLHYLPYWQSDSLEKWCHWWNGSQRRVILEACKVAMYFRRTASRFGQHSSKIFQRGGSILFLFFRSILAVLIEIYPKMTFSRFYRFSLGLHQNFGLFFWQIFYSISVYSDDFRTFLKNPYQSQ